MSEWMLRRDNAEPTFWSAVERAMWKDTPEVKERRQDYAQRLKIAVRKAHDRLFTNLRPEEKTPPPPPRPPAKP